MLTRFRQFFFRQHLGKAQKNKKCHTLHTITVGVDRHHPVVGDMQRYIASFRHPNRLHTAGCNAILLLSRVRRPWLRAEFFRYWAELRFM